jgi:hypothetical protein
MAKGPELPQVQVTIVVHDDGTQDRVRTNAEGTTSIDSYDGSGKEKTVLNRILRLVTFKDGDEIWEPVGSIEERTHAEIVGERMRHADEQLASVRTASNPDEEWRGKTAGDYLG